ncbi:MAG: POT family MFS transporter [Verrucomicrobiota bacterium]
MSAYRTLPAETERFPTGIPHIIGNEAAERFSFYGMKAVLAVFLAQYLHLMNEVPGLAMSRAAANEKVHLFNGFVYATPLLGAILSDAFFGKYRTIIWLSVVYCMGHAALALMGTLGEATAWLWMGLGLIALGSGGIKPCVSAHVGDQFGRKNAHLLTKIYNWFYFSINLGAFTSMLLTPWLLKWHGPHWAFGVPGVLMALATLVFWMGRERFVHIPAGGRQFFREVKSPEGLRAIGKLGGLFAFVAMFWALFDQHGSSWIFQAQDMDRNFLGWEPLPSQVQSLNSIFVLTLIPLFTFVVYPAVEKVLPLNPLRKIGAGLFLMVTAFVLVALVQTWIDGGARPNIGWQILATFLLTASEILVSIVALEFAYTQSPKTMKSFILSFYLLSVAAGNFLTSGINSFIQIPSPSEEMSERFQAGEFPTGEATLRHPGADGRGGSADDLSYRFENDVIADIDFAGKETFLEVEARVEAHWEESGRLPSLEEGARLVASSQDAWGHPLVYDLRNAITARLRSAGPDGERGTKWDLGLEVHAPEPAKEAASGGWLSHLRPASTWLERRQAELGVDDDRPQPEEGSLSSVAFVGGQLKMEGALYFWFFAGLMFVTALAFVPFAKRYEMKSYLQGDEEGGEATSP